MESSDGPDADCAEHTPLQNLSHVLVPIMPPTPLINEMLTNTLPNPGPNLYFGSLPQVWFLYIEGSVEDKHVHDQLGDKRDRLLSLKPLEGTGEPEDEAAFREAFPLNSVVWLRKGAGRVPAQVRPSPNTYMKFGQ